MSRAYLIVSLDINYEDKIMICEFADNKKTLAVAIQAAVESLETVTKTLKLQKVSKESAKRKLVISSNWLRSFLFQKGTPVVEEVMGYLQGMKIRLASSEDSDVKKVYERTYAKRPNEVQTDTRSQAKLNEAFGHATEVHITFTKGCLYIVPVFEKADKFVGNSITLNLQNNVGKDVLDTTIFNALDIVEQYKAKKVFIKSESSDYMDTKQSMLLALQLTRMGYTVSSDGTNNAAMVASIFSSDDEDDANNSILVQVPQLTEKVGFKEKVLSQVTPENIKNTFFMFSSGIDMYAMEQEGFVAKQLLEWRPIEDRDIKKKTCPETGEKVIDRIVDKTEVGAACAAMNGKNLVNIFNEDVYKFEFNRVAKAIRAAGRVGVVHASIQCDEFSNCKNDEDRAKAIADLSTTVDMFIPYLRTLEKLESPITILENVPGFVNDPVVFGLTEAYLKALGYDVHVNILNALEHNGYSSRKRMMLCASMLDGAFEMPESVERTAHLWNDYVVHNLDRFRDVSHTELSKKIREGKLVYERVKAEKLNVESLSKKEQIQHRKYTSSNWILPGADYCGTILKSQNRQVAESLVLDMDGKALFPDNEVIRFVMGVDADFNLDPSLTKEEACEILGQSVDVPMHKAFCQKVLEHMDNYFNGIKQSITKTTAKVLSFSNKELIEETTTPDVEVGYQYSLFA